MNKSLKFVGLITISLTVLLSIQTNIFAANAAWTILVYMQADNNLSDFANKDMTAMLSGFQKATVMRRI